MGQILQKSESYNAFRTGTIRSLLYLWALSHCPGTLSAVLQTIDMKGGKDEAVTGRMNRFVAIKSFFLV